MPRTPDDPTKAQAWLTQNGPEIGLELYVPRGNKGDPGGIVDGTSLAGGIDLNDLVTSGIWRTGVAADASLLKNYPVANMHGILMVLRSSATLVSQEYRTLSSTDQQGRSIYRRVQLNGTWYPWRFIPTQRVDQTAGRAIYTWDDVNQREQLVYGDTGWRNIYTDQGWLDALTNTGATFAGSGLVRVRRVGYVVDLVWVLDKAASGNVTPPSAFPLGFRPGGLWNAIGITSSLGLTRAYHPGGGSLLIYQSNAANLNATFSLTYTTTDAWPATLPGTASGSIPNL